MPVVTYPLDTTGLSPGNLILNEAHTLTELNSNTYNLIIPKFAPFYVDNFKLRHISDTGVITNLQEGYHYNFALMYLGGTRSIGKALYGGISIIETLVNGYISIDYQTLGGDWTADSQYVLTRLAEMAYNPRVTVWDVVTNKQQIFPPINHDNNMDYVYGHGELITKLNEIVVAIINSSVTLDPLLTRLINNIGIDKASFGLDQIANLPLATDTEVRNKTVVDKYVTLSQVVREILPNLDGSGNIFVLNSTTTVGNQVVDQVNTNVYRSLKYMVQINTLTNYQVSEILIIHNGVDAFITEYGAINTGSSLATFSADVLADKLRLLVTPNQVNTTIKVVRQTIEV